MPRMRLALIADADDPETMAVDESAPTTDPLTFHAILAVEGTPTGDGRVFLPESLTWADLPLPFQAVSKTTDGHLEAENVGRIDRIERMGQEIHAWGAWRTEDDPATGEPVITETAREFRDGARDGFVTGVSVDVDDVEVEIPLPDEDPETGEISFPGERIETDPETGGQILVVDTAANPERYRRARIIGATIVPFPALQEAGVLAAAADVAPSSGVVVVATVEGLDPVDGGLPADELHVTLGYFGSIDDIDGDTLENLTRFVDDQEALGIDATVSGVARMGFDDPPAVALLIESDRLNELRTALETVATPDGLHPHFTPHVTLGYGIDMPDALPPTVRLRSVALWAGEDRYDPTADVEALTAAAGVQIPAVPPSSWFADPNLTGPTPLTVTDDGRVFGHVALWGTCHVGFSGECVTPPKSRTQYAHFHTGEILCADGKRFAVGHITADLNHADRQFNAGRAAAHYDHTGWAAADVRVGEDEFGIWATGALRPGLNPAQIRKVMCSDVSGDWRAVGGNLELIGVQSVNVPGFGKPRLSIAASAGQVTALVAALNPRRRHPAPVQASGHEDDTARIIGRIAASIGRSPEARIAELRARVHGGS